MREWLLDLPMLAQDYLSWSRQMTGLLNGQRGEWSAKWRMMCEGLDPLAPAFLHQYNTVSITGGEIKIVQYAANIKLSLVN